MKKMLATLLLAMALLTVSAAAAENSMENFIRGQSGRVYDDQFSDLPEDSTFYENVAALYEYGLTIGKGDGTFGVKDSLTVSQIVIFAGRIRSLYAFGDAEAGANVYKTEEPRAVCMPYLDYLKAEGVLEDELDEVLFASATRAQMAHVLSRVLPQEAVPAVNQEIMSELLARGFVPDVTEETAYWQDILWLYDHGISHGSDEYGSFHPEDSITRGAVAAMLTRLVTPGLRIRIVWKEEGPEIPDLSGITLADLVEPGEQILSPQTDEEMDSAVRYMLSQNSDTLILSYPGISIAGAREKMLQALAIVRSYCEQSYNSSKTNFTMDGTVEIRFASTAAEGEKFKTYREEALAGAIAVHDELWKNGNITADMTELEKARVYYIWVCLNAEYDYEGAVDESVSHLPYGLFKNGLVVCDGYTGAYNLLLKLEGIDCTTYYTDTHIWTVATLDGTEYHIDATWGDAGDSARTAYFGMTEEESMILHDIAL